MSELPGSGRGAEIRLDSVDNGSQEKRMAGIVNSTLLSQLTSVRLTGNYDEV